MSQVLMKKENCKLHFHIHLTDYYIKILPHLNQNIKEHRKAQKAFMAFCHGRYKTFKNIH